MNGELCACFSVTDPDTIPTTSLRYVSGFHHHGTKAAILRLYLVGDNLAE